MGKDLDRINIATGGGCSAVGVVVDGAVVAVPLLDSEVASGSAVADCARVRPLRLGGSAVRLPLVPPPDRRRGVPIDGAEAREASAPLSNSLPRALVPVSPTADPEPDTDGEDR